MVLFSYSDMTGQILTEGTMGYLGTIIFAIVSYLTFTNLTYAYFKLRYFIPPLQKYLRRAIYYRCIAECARTGTIVLLAVWIALEIFCGLGYRITTETCCRRSSRAQIFYFYLLLNCRVL